MLEGFRGHILQEDGSKRTTDMVFLKWLCGEDPAFLTIQTSLLMSRLGWQHGL